MEKGPEFRIVGGISEEEKKEEKKYLRECLFGEKHLADLPEESKEELRKLEYSKTPEESALIDFANQKTNALMKKADVSPFDVPERNIHILPPEVYRKVDDEGKFTAITSTKYQVIFANAAELREDLLIFGSTIFHEFLHFKHHTTFELQRSKDKEDKERIEKTPFRGGIKVIAAQRKGLYGEYHEHFKGLNEAVVGVLEKKFTQELLKHPLLKKEREWLESKEAHELKKKIAQEKRITEEDICAVKPDERYVTYAYPKHQRVLSYILGEIQREFSQKYKNQDEVLQEFTKATFTGHLLPIARLVEKTFGKGSFRILGMMTEEKESAVQTMETLRLKRVDLKRPGKENF